jgi:hypothetical protein
MQQQQLRQQGGTALQAAATATDSDAGCPSLPTVNVASSVASSSSSSSGVHLSSHPIVLVDPSCESPCSSGPEEGPGDIE